MNALIGSRYPESPYKPENDHGCTAGNEPAKRPEHGGPETPPGFRVQWLEESWRASVATEHEQSHGHEDKHKKKEQRNRAARQARHELCPVKERADRHSRRRPNPCNDGSGWGGLNAHGVPSDVPLAY
jgi:hypothetical protein